MGTRDGVEAVNLALPHVSLSTTEADGGAQKATDPANQATDLATQQTDPAKDGDSPERRGEGRPPLGHTRAAAHQIGGAVGRAAHRALRRQRRGSTGRP